MLIDVQIILYKRDVQLGYCIVNVLHYHTFCKQKEIFAVCIVLHKLQDLVLLIA